MAEAAGDLQGDLQVFSAELVFQMMSLGRVSGVLILQRQTHQVRIWFENGDLRFATGNFGSKRARLGDTLIRAGKLSPRQRDNAVRALRRVQGDKRLGAILIERGLIEQADLEQFVRGQIKDVIYEVLRWRSGRFRFDNGVSVDSEDIVLDVPLDSLLLECLTRMDLAQQQQEEDA